MISFCFYAEKKLGARSEIFSKNFFLYIPVCIEYVLSSIHVCQFDTDTAEWYKVRNSFCPSLYTKKTEFFDIYYDTC